jgi:hypothetical protein
VGGVLDGGSIFLPTVFIHGFVGFWHRQWRRAAGCGNIDLAREQHSGVP